MRRVLIVSPHFPPFNGADMHRVRQSLPYFRELGWEAVTLAADPAGIEGAMDPDLLATLPDDAKVHRVHALSYRWTRKLGLGSLALRMLPFLSSAGARLLRQARREGRPFDIVYFSTTQFPVVTLGPVWKRRFGVPYVVDIQDPWRSDHYLGVPPSERPPKFWLSYRMDRALEPRALRGASGLVSVSPSYVDVLKKRYPALARRPAAVIPFGGAVADFEALEHIRPNNPIFNPGDGLVHAVYVGRGGHDMAHAARGIFGALARGVARRPDVYNRVRFHLVGTDYAPEGRGKKTFEPLAHALGVAGYVREYPRRVPYFTALHLLRQADLLVIPGSTDPAYTASKLYPYILAERPLLAVFNRQSSVVEVLERTGAGATVTFEGNAPEDADALAETVYQAWTAILDRLPETPRTDWAAFEPYTAREMTRRQVALFEEVLAQRAAARRRTRAAPRVQEGAPRVREG